MVNLQRVFNLGSGVRVYGILIKKSFYINNNFSKNIKPKKDLLKHPMNKEESRKGIEAEDEYAKEKMRKI